MVKSERIAICGGGHVAHSLAAILSEWEDILCLTRQPVRWGNRLSYRQGAKTLKSCNYRVRAVDNPRELSNADIIFIALPKFAVYEELEKIDSSLRAGQTVCVVHAPAGLERLVDGYLDRGVDLVGFQRVPYISRIIEYGHSVSISDSRAEHKLVVSRPELKAVWSDFCRERFGGQAFYLSSFFTFAFSNAGALLHPARMVELFKGWCGKPFSRNPHFYAEWTDSSSELYVESDYEMMSVMRQFREIDLAVDYESALAHYGVKSVCDLTQKIRSIPSFKDILSPMKEVKGGWIPDFASRYFTEDVTFGTKVMQDYARMVGVSTPVIDSLIERMCAFQEVEYGNG